MLMICYFEYRFLRKAEIVDIPSSKKYDKSIEITKYGDAWSGSVNR